MNRKSELKKMRQTYILTRSVHIIDSMYEAGNCHACNIACYILHQNKKEIILIDPKIEINVCNTFSILHHISIRHIEKKMKEKYPGAVKIYEKALSVFEDTRQNGEVEAYEQLDATMFDFFYEIVEKEFTDIADVVRGKYIREIDKRNKKLEKERQKNIEIERQEKIRLADIRNQRKEEKRIKQEAFEQERKNKIAEQKNFARKIVEPEITEEERIRLNEIEVSLSILEEIRIKEKEEEQKRKNGQLIF